MVGKGGETATRHNGYRQKFSAWCGVVIPYESTSVTGPDQNTDITVATAPKVFCLSFEGANSKPGPLGVDLYCQVSVTKAPWAWKSDAPPAEGWAKSVSRYSMPAPQ